MTRDKIIGGLGLLKALLRDQESQAILDGARELLKDQPQWISCDDQLPPEGDTVLTLIFGHDVIAQRLGETLDQALRRIGKIKTVSAGFLASDGWYDVEGYPEIVHPSYWMPLPKAPDQDQLRRGVLDKEAFHRLMVHNTGNVDIPDGLTRDQFNSVADAFVEAIEHTFRGESWPYDQKGEPDHG